MDFFEKNGLVGQFFNKANAVQIADTHKEECTADSLDGIQVIEIEGVRYLTTAILAERYGTDNKIIANNFNRNKERYEEGKHYICLKGAKLQEFFANIKLMNANQSKIRNLYLWTERGAFLHAKSLNTDEAWESYEKLIEVYFRAQKAQNVLKNLSPQTQAMINLEIRQNNLESRVNDIECRMKDITAEPEPEPALMKSEPKKWSEREKDYLRNAYALGQTDTEIAATLKRTTSAVTTKRYKLGLYANGAPNAWTPDEDKKLLKLHNKGVTYQEISKIIGRSFDAVQSRLYKLRRCGKI